MAALSTALGKSKRRAAAADARQNAQRQQQRDDAERDVDREQPRPRREGEDRAADDRTGGRADRDHQRALARRTPEHRARVRVPVQRADRASSSPPRRRPAARAQARARRASARAKHASDATHEHDEADAVDARVADDVAERRAAAGSASRS